MKCPNCGGTFFHLLMDFSATDNPEQQLTENDIVTCDDCGYQYCLGELVPHGGHMEEQCAAR